MSLKSILATLCFCLPLAVSAAEPKYVEDTDFRTLATPLTVDTAPGKVEVRELFYYGCPHCYQMEPALQAWLKKKPANVEFVRMPAVFTRDTPTGKTWFAFAKAFYAAEALGVGEKIHKPLFESIHKDGKKMEKDDDFAEFFAKHGVATKEFKETFNSFAIEAKAARAMDITQRSGVDGVPALIVNGKYQVLGKRAKSYQDLFAIVDHLVASELARR